jgi:hypothetical protein
MHIYGPVWIICIPTVMYTYMYVKVYIFYNRSFLFFQQTTQFLFECTCVHAYLLFVVYCFILFHHVILTSHDLSLKSCDSQFRSED